jgi:hypothetical protein
MGWGICVMNDRDREHALFLLEETEWIKEMVKFLEHRLRSNLLVLDSYADKSRQSRKGLLKDKGDSLH